MGRGHNNLGKSELECQTTLDLTAATDNTDDGDDNWNECSFKGHLPGQPG